MRAVVTGGLGFIGSHLAEELIARGIEVTVVDDRRTAAIDAIPGAHHIYLPVAAAQPVRADVVFHLAGPVGPVGVLEHAGRIVPQVVGDATTVADWCALLWSCPLVYVSTSEVYGLQQQPVHEEAPRIIAAGSSARMEYAVAKLAAETMLLNRSGLDVRIIRPFNVAGPRQGTRGGFVIPRFLRQVAEGQTLTVYAPGTQERAFTHVRDIADGIIRAWTHGQPRRVYNLGNPANRVTITGLAEMVVDVTGSGCPIEVVDPQTIWGSGFREAPDKVPDPARAIAELDWSPRHDLRTIIADAMTAMEDGA